MSDHTTYVRIDGDPFLSRAKAYREKRQANLLAWSDACRAFGAIGIPSDLHGLNFGPNSPPEGWLKPRGKVGWSQPKKGHPDEDLLAALREARPLPSPYAVYGQAICENLNYEMPDGSTSHGGIGRMWRPHIGWAGDVFLGHIADAEAAVADLRERHPNAVILNGAATWTLPAGLTRISKAEYDLVFAQHAVEEERKATLPAPSHAERTSA